MSIHGEQRRLSPIIKPGIFSGVQEAGWATIVGFLVAASTIPLLLRLLFEAQWELVQQISEGTRGLVHASLLFGVVASLMVVGGLLLGLGRLRAQDVGLIKSRLPIALSVFLGLWLATQLILLLAGWLGGQGLSLDGAWREQGVLAVLGKLLGQLLGMSLFEETTFRGFLLPQLYLKFNPNRTPQGLKPWAGALVVSQFFWACCHLPNRLFPGANEGPIVLELLVTTAVGILIAFIYMRTGNLWLVVGLHALGNRPTPLLAPPIDPNVVLSGLVILVVVGWPWLERRVLQRLPGGP